MNNENSQNSITLHLYPPESSQEPPTLLQPHKQKSSFISTWNQRRKAGSRSAVACIARESIHVSLPNKAYFRNKARAVPAHRVKTYSGHMVTRERAGRLRSHRNTLPRHKKGSVNPKALLKFPREEKKTTTVVKSLMFFCSVKSGVHF